MHRLLTCLPLSKVPQKVMGTYVPGKYMGTYPGVCLQLQGESVKFFFCACPARHGARHRRAAAAARSPRLRCQLFGRGAGGAGCRSEEHAALCKRATGSVWCEVSVAESQQQLIASSAPWTWGPLGPPTVPAAVPAAAPAAVPAFASAVAAATDKAQ
jgi:hypothetical protein